MTRINTNVGATRGLRNLNKANSKLDSAIQRLSTGSQINSGKDNPSGLIGSEKLRFQVTTIEQSIKNSNRASNVIATADGALGEISGLLNQIRGLVQEGLNSGALSDTEIEANQLQIDTALSAINRISSNTTFGGDKLIDGSKGFNTSFTAANAAKISDFQVNEALLGTSSSISVDATVTSAAEKAELRYSGGNITSATTLEVSGNIGSQVLQFDTGSTVANVRDAINSVSESTGVSATIGDGLVLTKGATAGTFELSTNAIKNSLDVAGTGGGNITFTDLRGDADQGTDATIGQGTLSITLTNGTNSNGASSVSAITVDSSGNTNIEIDLADDGTNSTATFADIQAAIAANSAASALVSVSDNASAGVIDAAASADLAGGVDGEAVTFTDNRATAVAGAFETLGGSLSIEFTNGVGNGLATTATAATDSEGAITVSIVLGTDGSGNVNATLADVVTAIADDQTAGGAAEFITSSGDTGGTTLVTSAAATTFTDGNDGLNNDVSFTDVRSDPSVGTARVAFADPGSADQALSITIGGTANDPDITVNLATDADGNIISTAADVAAAINADAAASLIVNATAEGDGSETVADTGGLANGVVDAGSGALILTSNDFGSRQFVEVDVLSGSFATTLDDSTTAAGRDTGADIGVTINGQVAETDGLKASIRTGSLDASITFETSANTAANTAGFTITGGGATFQIGEEVSTSGQIGIGIESVNTARLGGLSGKLYELGSGGGKSLLDIGPGQSGADLVGIIEDALDRVSTLRGRLGAIQKNVIETNVATLGVALENISEARSQIVDTDFAVETANLTKSQILSQAGISVLSIANQQPQQVLSLLG
ncbi:MAG: flagellin [Planctomycetota bacterium]|nr:flagellin [Planctomycetota bacterium]MDA0920895.1 flagellin [Planctomycetota bacterium]